MAWVRVDDGFSDHPKALDLSLAAKGLWLDALCYANRQRTDGFIPAGMVRRTGGDAALVDELVNSTLWQVADGGWQIHDYDDWQRTREQIEDIGQKRAEAGRKGALAKHQQTSGKLPANGRQPAGKPLAEEEREKETEPKQNENDDARPRATAAPSVVEHPFALLEALCDEIGEDVSVLSKSGKDKQLGVAKRLRDDGLCADDVRKMVRWLRSQEWVTGGIDLLLVEKFKDRWRLSGKPERIAANGRASPSRSAGMDHLRALAKGAR